ncbi:unnamed protein product [Mytilus edulis]|uniref:P2X purinoreceptor 7 intracellular domain-containing protein n=1 Tax=Mytilus edulis TaxID=6550 RepID=A0A8S3QJJ5_MYTED|nr:unnamed protein product [Mytilus edulis]
MDGVDSSLQGNSQSLDIRPYQFEPLLVENNQEEDINSSSEESDIDDLSSNVDRLVNTNWCDCGNCNSMTTADECVCCSDISAVSYLMQPDDLNCITEHEVFIANCLNRHVLQVSMYAYMEHVGPFDDNEPINEKYRFMAYRIFVQWIWHRLGRHNRKILPACVVKKIRDNDYEKALKKRQRALESSNVDTNDEEEARRAVKQPQRLGHDFSDSEEEEKRPTRRDGDRRTPSTSARTPSPPTRRTPSPRTRRTPTPPTYDPSSAYHGKNSNRNRSRSPLRSTPERRRRSLSTPDSGRRTSTIRATPEGPVVRELERRHRVLPDFERDSQEVYKSEKHVCLVSRKIYAGKYE